MEETTKTTTEEKNMGERLRSLPGKKGWIWEPVEESLWNDFQ